jgi:hypothetical protein
VLAVLAAFDDSHPRLRLSEVARRSGLPVSTVSRLLAELVAGEALARRPDGRYEVGRRLWQLGLLAPVNQELREVALPFIHDIQTATGDVVHIAVREGIAALYVERVVGRGPGPYRSRLGPARVPAISNVIEAITTTASGVMTTAGSHAGACSATRPPATAPDTMAAITPRLRARPGLRSRVASSDITAVRVPVR